MDRKTQENYRQFRLYNQARQLNGILREWQLVMRLPLCHPLVMR
jgi:hypothetical protein